MRALLDNSAIRILALRDPTGEKSNRYIRRCGLFPVISHFSIGEIAKGLALNPNLFDEVRARCQYILSLENLVADPDIPIAHQLELTSPGHLHLSSFDTHEELCGFLRDVVDDRVGQYDLSSRVGYYQSGEDSMRTTIERINREEDLVNVLKGQTWDECLSGPLLGRTVQALLMQTYTTLSKRGANAIDPDRLQAAPWHVAAARVNLYINWRVANRGSLPRDLWHDLKFLQNAHACELLVTCDSALANAAQDVFPNARYINPKGLRPFKGDDE